MLVKLRSCTINDYYPSVRYNKLTENFSYIQESKRLTGESCNRKNAMKSKLLRSRVLAVSVLLMIILCIIIFSTNAYGSTPVYYDNVIVEQGDSLWGIAQKYCNEGTDIRILINNIIKLNNIKGDYIYPGMVLKVPVKQ